MGGFPSHPSFLDTEQSSLPLSMQDDYAQKTGLVSAALSFSDEQKKEVCT